MTDDADERVRRSIFLPQELETALSRLAAERETSANDLICEILAERVSALNAEPSPAQRDTGVASGPNDLR